MNRNERRRADHHRRMWEMKIQKFILDCNDCCSCCARPFTGMERTFLGLRSDRQLMYVGTCCASKVKVVFARGVAISEREQIQYPSREDLAWFAANLDRSHRIRPPLRGEFFDSELPPEPKVIVRMIEPGVHQRVIVGGSEAQIIPDGEAFLKATCDFALKAHDAPLEPAQAARLTAQYLLALETTSS